MSLSIEELRACCEKVRAAGQYAANNKLVRVMEFSAFPAGWCGFLSNVLGAYLGMRYPGEDFNYICGEIHKTYDDWFSHAWIQYGDVILDITADQFSEVDVPIIICKKSESSFHSRFEITSDHRTYDYNELNYDEQRVFTIIGDISV